MFFEFTTLVAFLAVVYAGITKFVQNKLVDRSEMEGLQKESKRLSEEFEKAKKAGNQKKMDEVMKQQLEFLPKMNKAMMAQFKPMIVILGVFFIFTWGVGQLDPTTKDDILMNLSDDGQGCDAEAGDGIHSGCLLLDSENTGKWMFMAKAYRGSSDAGHNSTYFLYGTAISDGYAEGPAGEPVMVSTDKAEYSKGETVKLYAKTGAERVEARLDHGTAFAVELPLAIPILNVKTIHQAYWWFIFISITANLTLTFVLGRLKKA